MESYQPWPIFNVQNELAEVQKKKKTSSNSNQVNDYMYFFQILCLLDLHLTLMLHPTTLTDIILHRFSRPFSWQG